MQGVTMNKAFLHDAVHVGLRTQNIIKRVLLAEAQHRRQHSAFGSGH